MIDIGKNIKEIRTREEKNENVWSKSWYWDN